MQLKEFKNRIPLLIALLGAVICLETSSGHAQIRAGAAYLKILPGARQQNMANSLTAGLDEFFSVYANPGAAGFLREWQLSASYVKWIADIYNTSFLAGQQFRLNMPWSNRFYLGAGLNYQGIGNFDATQGLAPSVSAQDLLLVASLGLPVDKWVKHLAFGTNVKYLKTDLAQFTAKTLAFDVGALYRTSRIVLPFGFDYAVFSAGFSVSNLGTSMTFITDATPLPRTFRSGLGVHLGSHDGLQLQLTGELRKVRDERSQIAVGTEAVNFLSLFMSDDAALNRYLGRLLTLRGGFIFNEGQNSRLVSKVSFGFSLRLDDYMNLQGRSRIGGFSPRNTVARADVGYLNSTTFSNIAQAGATLHATGPESFAFVETPYLTAEIEARPEKSYKESEPVAISWAPSMDPDLYDDVNYLLVLGHENRQVVNDYVDLARRNSIADSLLTTPGSPRTPERTDVRLLYFRQQPITATADVGDLPLQRLTSSQEIEVQDGLLTYADFPRLTAGDFYFTILAYDRNGHFRVTQKSGSDIGRFYVKPNPDLTIDIVPDQEARIAEVTITNAPQSSVDEEVSARIFAYSPDGWRTHSDSILVHSATYPQLEAGESRNLQLPWNPDFPYMIARVDPDNAIFETDELNNFDLDSLLIYDIQVTQKATVQPLQIELQFPTDQTVPYDEDRQRFLEMPFGQLLGAISLGKFANSHIEVAGHTDEVGRAGYNDTLSYNRALWVKSTLVEEFGFNVSEVCAFGYGENAPVHKNVMARFRRNDISRNERNRLNKANRRVEMRVLQDAGPLAANIDFDARTEGQSPTPAVKFFAMNDDRDCIPGGNPAPIVLGGQNISYEITVKNLGPMIEARNVLVTAVLPPEVEVVESSLKLPPSSISDAKDRLSWNLDQLAAGESTTFSYRVRVRSRLDSLVQLVNEINTSAQYDINPQNDTTRAEILAVGSETKTPSQRTIHTVRRAESLTTIAKNYSASLGYKISWQDIYFNVFVHEGQTNQERIGCNPDFLVPGMPLVIPMQDEIGAGEGQTMNAPPSAVEVKISRKADNQNVLVGSYRYVDKDGDPEGNSRFQWRRNGRPIPGATKKLYALTPNDNNSELTFEVTPVAQTGGCTRGKLAKSGIVQIVQSQRSPVSVPASLDTSPNNGSEHSQQDTQRRARRLPGDN